jgi:hypothetical protein
MNPDDDISTLKQGETIALRRIVFATGQATFPSLSLPISKPSPL